MIRNLQKHSLDLTLKTRELFVKLLMVKGDVESSIFLMIRVQQMQRNVQRISLQSESKKKLLVYQN